MSIFCCSIALMACFSASEPPAPASKPTVPLRVVVLDANGKPIVGASVLLNLGVLKKFANASGKTDETGSAQFAVDTRLESLQVWVGAPKFAGEMTSWSKMENGKALPLPTEFKFRLVRGLSLSGRILDEDGKPIPGAAVEAQAFPVRNTNAPDGNRFQTFFAFGEGAVKTDANGRWLLETVPPQLVDEFSLKIFHPDYVSDEIWGKLQRQQNVVPNQFHSGSAEIRLKKGAIVQGQILDDQGKPVADAVVSAEDRPSFPNYIPRQAKSDAHGCYRLPAQAPGFHRFVVIAKGFAPELVQFDGKPGVNQQDVRLSPGRKIQFRVVDSSGKPARASVDIDSWRSTNFLYVRRNDKLFA